MKINMTTYTPTNDVYTTVLSSEFFTDDEWNYIKPFLVSRGTINTIGFKNSRNGTSKFLWRCLCHLTMTNYDHYRQMKKTSYLIIDTENQNSNLSNHELYLKAVWCVNVALKIISTHNIKMSGVINAKDNILNIFSEIYHPQLHFSSVGL